ncbi:MAG: HAD family hydrolase [Gammaproteobacteria bacterium]|jgi:TFIIF-interacting CTD phosphatase-like protein|nr:HAD family hydrolase [Gammaproteobacteria bacterium]
MGGSFFKVGILGPSKIDFKDNYLTLFNRNLKPPGIQNKMAHHQHRKLVVLDLDATLISAQSLDKYDKEANVKKSSKFEKSYQMDNVYQIFARPHLDIFLNYLFSNFRVGVWTAASQLYALSVIDNLILTKPSRKLEFIMFDYHNEDAMKRGRGTKDLDLLKSFYGMDLNDRDVIIIDDYDAVCKVNKRKSIKARFFEYTKRGSENDKFLLTLIPKLKKFKQK